MTEKRFKAHIFDDGVNERYHDGIIDNEDNDDSHVIVNYQSISNLLNELYDENEQLKNSDTITDLETQIMKLKDENEQLKTYLKALREELSLADRDNTVFEKENKELKTVLNKTLKQLYNAQTSQIYEYSSNITKEEKQLKEHFKEKYGKYGGKND